MLPLNMNVQRYRTMRKKCNLAILCYDSVCKNVSMCAEFVLVACS